MIITKNVWGLRSSEATHSKNDNLLVLFLQIKNTTSHDLNVASKFDCYIREKVYGAHGHQPHPKNTNSSSPYAFPGDTLSRISRRHIDDR